MALTRGFCHHQRLARCTPSHSLECSTTSTAALAHHSIHSLPGLTPSARRMRGACRAGSESTDGEDSPESLFEKELRKRGLTGGAVKADDRDDTAPKSSREGGRPAQLPQFRGQADGSNADQLERSRKLNSEGLEGLIPRATELAKLGGSFWVSFYPFIGAIIAAFIVLYLFSGSTFIHQGNSRMAVPDYLDRSLFSEEPSSQQSQTEPAGQGEAAAPDSES